MQRVASQHVPGGEPYPQPLLVQLHASNTRGTAGDLARSALLVASGAPAHASSPARRRLALTTAASDVPHRPPPLHHAARCDTGKGRRAMSSQLEHSLFPACFLCTAARSKHKHTHCLPPSMNVCSVGPSLSSDEDILVQSNASLHRACAVPAVMNDQASACRNNAVQRSVPVHVS